LILLAPIVLFVYARPQHTLQALESLAQNDLAKESELYIFADGAKPNANSLELQNIHQTRQIIRQTAWAGKVTIIEQSENLGTKQAIESGVSQLITQYGKIIVLEDDLVLSPYFITFMNQALDFYADNPKVMQINGYVPDFALDLPPNFFCAVPSSWGWATWARAWQYYNADTDALYQNLVTTQKLRSFNFTGVHLDYLNKNRGGHWHIYSANWYASIFLEDGLCLSPNQSLVQNIGVDGSGEHCAPSEIHHIKKTADFMPLLPIPVIESQVFRCRLRAFNRYGGVDWKAYFEYQYNWWKGKIYRLNPNFFRKIKRILRKSK
jgi:hypothetical protein